MMKKVLLSALLSIMAVLSMHGLAGMAQAVMTPPGKFFPSTQLKKTLDDDKSPQSVVAGQAAIIIPPENFTIRRRVDGPNNASVHTKEGDGNDVTRGRDIFAWGWCATLRSHGITRSPVKPVTFSI